MSWLWWLLGVIVIVIWIATIVNIIQRWHERSTASSCAWIILVLVLPLFGTVLYLLVNGVSTGRPPIESGPPRPGSQ